MASWLLGSILVDDAPEVHAARVRDTVLLLAAEDVRGIGIGDDLIIKCFLVGLGRLVIFLLHISHE